MMLTKVPFHLTRDNPEAMGWLADESNLKSLEQFLSIHGLDIDNTREVHFSNQGFRVVVYELDDKGNKVLDEEGYNAKVSHRKVSYLTKKPTWA